MVNIGVGAARRSHRSVVNASVFYAPFGIHQPLILNLARLTVGYAQRLPLLPQVAELGFVCPLTTAGQSSLSYAGHEVSRRGEQASQSRASAASFRSFLVAVFELS